MTPTSVADRDFSEGVDYQVKDKRMCHELYAIVGLSRFHPPLYRLDKLRNFLKITFYFVWLW